MGGLFSTIASWFGGREASENPVFEEIKERERQAEEQRRREAAEKEAREAGEARDKAEADRRKAEEDAQKAEEARKEEEKKANEARENAERYRKEGEEQKQKAEESAKKEKEAKDEAERVRKQAEVAAVKAKVDQEAAEEAKRVAREEARKATQAAEEATKKWREGIQPEVWPTQGELNSTKKRLGYTEGAYHFAVAGIAGSGKSSLINALRGVTNDSPYAAKTGITETTLTVTAYPDPDPNLPFIWYDAPGAGTLSIPGWQYFNQQGLYIFDCIIVLFDNRFTATDIAILENCARFKIPAYIVRSKSDQNVNNVLKDVRRTYKKDKLSETELRKRSKEIYTKETQESVDKGLEMANLPSQRAYLISQDVLCHLRIAKGRGSSDGDDEEGLMDEEDVQANIVHEEELLRDIMMNAKDRRPTRQKATGQSSGGGLRAFVGGVLSGRQSKNSNEIGPDNAKAESGSLLGIFELYS